MEVTNESEEIGHNKGIAGEMRFLVEVSGDRTQDKGEFSLSMEGRKEEWASMSGRVRNLMFSLRSGRGSHLQRVSRKEN